MSFEKCHNAENVLKFVKEKNVSFIQFWFTDVLGMLKSFAVTPAELEMGLSEGMGFDGSSIEGFARIEESDMIAMPKLGRSFPKCLSHADIMQSHVWVSMCLCSVERMAINGSPLSNDMIQ